jgi:penicillin-insensitive murein endopeptidase
MRKDNLMSDDIDPLRPRPIKDVRGYFMLPQGPMDSGYYVYGNLYGKPAKGAYQYPTATMMTSILRVALEWQAIDARRMGVGDISMAGGPETPDHQSHRNGMQVDIRPLRIDGAEEKCTWKHPLYDQIATERLINVFRTFAPVVRIYFNDPEIPFVLPRPHHDDHFHVELRG